MPRDDADIGTVIGLLRARTGAGHAAFKPQVIRGALERRARARRVALSKYVRIAQAEPRELDRLAEETLVGVTAFFRDPDAFEALGAELGRRFDQLPADASIRIWSIGCANGEEVVSIAILVDELMRRRRKRFAVRILATDASKSAIAAARRGTYERARLEGVDAQRRKKYFSEEGRRFRVAFDLRRNIVFAEHDVFQDPPFGRIDLVICRNLLIYLRPAAQEQVLRVAHYALPADGLLFLGAAESVCALPEAFDPVDSNARIYRRTVTDVGAPSTVRSYALRRRDEADLRDEHSMTRAELLEEVARQRDRERCAREELETAIREAATRGRRGGAGAQRADAFLAARTGVFATTRDLVVCWSSGRAFGGARSTAVGRAIDTLLDPDASNAIRDLAARARLTGGYARDEVRIAEGTRTTTWAVHVTPIDRPSTIEMMWWVREIVEDSG